MFSLAQCPERKGWVEGRRNSDPREELQEGTGSCRGSGAPPPSRSSPPSPGLHPTSRFHRPSYTQTLCSKKQPITAPSSQRLQPWKFWVISCPKPRVEESICPTSSITWPQGSGNCCSYHVDSYRTGFPTCVTLTNNTGLVKGENFLPSLKLTKTKDRRDVF